MSVKKSGEIEEMAFGKQELLPAIIQEAASGEVLMLAYMNRQSLEKTLQTGLTWFWSRSRQRFWQKGETSGHIQEVQEIRYDCDGDTLLILVRQKGPACHTGQRSCFFNRLPQEKGPGSDPMPGALSEPDPGDGLPQTTAAEEEILPWLTEVIRERLRSKPSASYVAALLQEGPDHILKKLAEETAEVLLAAKGGSREELVREAADLLFHLLVLLEASGVQSGEVVKELWSRRGE